ncbi:right-handed parallel beta-helix repeat-containing protein [Methanobrevibacter sp.]|uniref:right-handed parallel beta-helix repeat-containing protein n=1 Tax=Methanobrevibacter sp. TaxID=66852 RepID=UPI00388DD8CB
MLNLKRLMILVIMSACLLITVSGAFAADSNQIRGNVTADGQNHKINIDNLNVMEVDKNANSQINLKDPIQNNIKDNGSANGGVPGSYDDLKDDIENLHSGDVYNFTRDYIFDGNGQTLILQDRIIAINQDNIIINGNGFTIDAGGCQNFAIFKISGNNVTISNLTFANSVPGSMPDPKVHGNYSFDRINSPICWQGNNGTMKDCNFYNNCAVNGGAMTWTGNNGTIENCRFINNTARGVGGALYIGGVNNTVSWCVFVNSTSQLTGEAIYADRNREKIRFVNDTFNNKIPVIDGVESNIDVDYLFYSYKIPVWGNISAEKGYKLDIIPLLYKAIMVGGVNNISEDFNYFAQYFKESGDFILNFAAYEEISDYVYLDKYAKDMLNFKVDWIESFHIDIPSLPVFHFGFNYLKSMSFSYITDFNQVFDRVLHENYKLNLTQNLIGFVHDVYDYSDMSSVKGWDQWFDTDKGVDNFVNNFEVIFTDKINAESDVCWRPNISDFDSILIMGNGSTIDGGSKDDRGEKKWVEMGGDRNTIFAAYDLTVKNYNTAVECFAGQCYFNNVRFDNNRMKYIIERDWGAAIINTDTIVCVNCSFTNNYANNGGAIFNQGFLSLNHCTFKGNKAYGEGDNVCVGDGGMIQVDYEDVISDTKDIWFADGLSEEDYGWMSIVVSVGAFAAGFLASAFTCNPFIGMAIGAAIGTGFGILAAEYCFEASCSINLDKGKYYLDFVLMGAVFGVLGGACGQPLYNFIGEISSYAETGSLAADASSIADAGSLVADVSSIADAGSLVADIPSIAEVEGFAAEVSSIADAGSEAASTAGDLDAVLSGVEKIFSSVSGYLP